MDEVFADRVVLVIEDDRQLLLAMAQAFSRSGARVFTAADGAEGLRCFMAESPDVVITDIIMPEREGVETILAMKAARPEAPILAVSGGGHTPARQFLSLAEALGADAVLAKPFRSQELIAAVRKLLDPSSIDAAA